MWAFYLFEVSEVRKTEKEYRKNTRNFNGRIRLDLNNLFIYISDKFGHIFDLTRNSFYSINVHRRNKSLLIDMRENRSKWLEFVCDFRVRFHIQINYLIYDNLSMSMSTKRKLSLMTP